MVLTALVFWHVAQVLVNLGFFDSLTYWSRVFFENYEAHPVEGHGRLVRGVRGHNAILSLVLVTRKFVKNQRSEKIYEKYPCCFVEQIWKYHHLEKLNSIKRFVRVEGGNGILLAFSRWARLRRFKNPCSRGAGQQHSP